MCLLPINWIRSCMSDSAAGGSLIHQKTNSKMEPVYVQNSSLAAVFVFPHPKSTVKPALHCFLTVSKKDTTCLYLESLHDQQPHLENHAGQHTSASAESLLRCAETSGIPPWSTVPLGVLLSSTAAQSGALLCSKTVPTETCVLFWHNNKGSWWIKESVTKIDTVLSNSSLFWWDHVRRVSISWD